VGRFTKVDRCGAVVPGPVSTVVTEGLITATITPTNDAGTTITVANAAGKNLINNIPTPRFTNFTVSIALLGVDPELVKLLTNQATWEGIVAGTITGFTIADDIDPELYGFAMELWSGVDGNVCAGGTVQYGYFLMPWLRGGAVDAITWANDAINFTITGAASVGGNTWGVGPYMVTQSPPGTDSALRQALGTRVHFLYDLVTKAPPTSVCGGQPLGTAPTGATAGIPGAYTPAGRWTPVNLAGLTGVTASPATAWTTGQYVATQDGLGAHWNGTTWVSGPKP
jgi:hypothetical protein